MITTDEASQNLRKSSKILFSKHQKAVVQTESCSCLKCLAGKSG